MCMEGLIETIDEEDRENIFLMDDTDIFSSNTLPCGSSTPAGVVGTIINPLRYKPCYGKVLVIRNGYIITAFMNSASRKAKYLACVMAKFFENIVLKPVAASNARKLGYEEFVKSIQDPDIKSLILLEKEKTKVLEARALIDKTIPSIHVHPEHGIRRVGCVKLTYNQVDDASGEVVMNFTETRDTVKNRKSIYQSYRGVVNANYKLTHLYTLLGGANVINVRSHLEHAFGSKRGFTARFPCSDLRDAKEKIERIVIPMVCQSFVFGLAAHEHRRLIFFNERMNDSLPDEDKAFCDHYVRCLGGKPRSHMSIKNTE